MPGIHLCTAQMDPLVMSLPTLLACVAAASHYKSTGWARRWCHACLGPRFNPRPGRYIWGLVRHNWEGTSIFVDVLMTLNLACVAAASHYKYMKQELSQDDKMLRSFSLSGGFMPCRHLRPSSGRERVSEWWFNAVSVTKAIFTARTC